MRSACAARAAGRWCSSTRFTASTRPSRMHSFRTWNAGDIILIGATTENPSFEVVSALLSRSKVYALRALSMDEIVTLLERGASGSELAAPRRTAGADRDLLPMATRARRTTFWKPRPRRRPRRRADREAVQDRDRAQGAAVRQGRRGALQSGFGAAQDGAFAMRMRRCTGWRGCCRAGKTGCTWRAAWCGWRSKTSAWRIRARWSRPWRRSRRSISWVFRRAIRPWRRWRCIWHRAEVGRGVSGAERGGAKVEKTTAEPVPMQLRNAPTKP